ncbi:hypothetical protein PHSY_007434 [Pseudozyma hubeiensis SY62]|uniref:GLTSCR protein conserved domain-containing protein n=1 Tax=Pseudozyma hubeiensis (strain SY62) TaxID=1305764 RepID=R9PES6_PSEHS|nr:hypothetical protein PHSY_007434 [Pseudozyma hubeiensis SY62]GAC99831.1 hypothetical protein PHSY_007434 [Pseudozyma hubeiensis SY62]
MQASSPFSSSISTPALDPRATSNTHNAALTIDPAALLGAGSASLYPAQASVPGSSTSVLNTTSSTNGIGSRSQNTLDRSAAQSIAVKQEPEDENASSLAASHNVAGLTEDAGDARLGSRQPSTSVGAYRNDKPTSRGSEQPGKDPRSEERLKGEPVTLVDKLLHSDHKAILRPDLSPFTDARDVLRRLLPYHVWNIPHHDLLKALDLHEDPVLSQVRSRKRRRIAQLHTNKPASASTDHGQPTEASTDLSRPVVQPSTDQDDEQAPHTTRTGRDSADTEDKEYSDLSELGLPVPLPEVPQPPFPDLDFAESAFARRHALASRFRRTLTALETTHRRAPSTALSLEHLERLAYSDDREEVLAQIEHLKSLKLELETLEDNRQIDAAESSAKINLRFGITDEIERERERERELERVKRQQERAAAKAAKLEKEREARHRIGIFTPQPETISTPAPPSPTSTSAATPAPSTLPTGVPAASLAMPSPYSGFSTPASTPAAYPFPPGANLPYAPNMSMPPPGPNAAALSAQFGPPMMYGSVSGTQLGSAPSFASTSAAARHRLRQQHRPNHLAKAKPRRRRQQRQLARQERRARRERQASHQDQHHIEAEEGRASIPYPARQAVHPSRGRAGSAHKAPAISVSWSADHARTRTRLYRRDVLIDSSACTWSCETAPGLAFGQCSIANVGPTADHAPDFDQRDESQYATSYTACEPFAFACSCSCSSGCCVQEDACEGEWDDAEASLTSGGHIRTSASGRTGTGTLGKQRQPIDPKSSHPAAHPSGIAPAAVCVGHPACTESSHSTCDRTQRTASRPRGRAYRHRSDPERACCAAGHQRGICRGDGGGWWQAADPAYLGGVEQTQSVAAEWTGRIDAEFAGSSRGG